MTSQQGVPSWEGLAGVVGARLRLWREGNGYSQDRVAQLFQENHLPWRRSTISAIEAGERELTIGELLAASAVTGMPLTSLVEPIGGGDIEIAPLCGMSAGAVRWLLGGGSPAEAEGLHDVRVLGAIDEWIRSQSEPPRESIEERVRVSARRDAEIKAAKRMDLTPVLVAALAQRAWGRSLTEEREARLAEAADEDRDPRATQALRGHITRGLVNHLMGVQHDLERAGQPLTLADVLWADDATDQTPTLADALWADDPDYNPEEQS